MSQRSAAPMVDDDEPRATPTPGLTWRPAAAEPEPPARAAWTRHIAFALLLTAGILGAIGIFQATSRYIAATRGLRGVSLEVVGVQLVDDENPRAIVRFRVLDRFPIRMTVERYMFALNLNDLRVGSSYARYTGTDPTVTEETQRQAAEIGLTLGDGESLEWQHAVYLDADGIALARAARAAGRLRWEMEASIQVRLPYRRDRDVVGLVAAREE